MRGNATNITVKNGFCCTNCLKTHTLINPDISMADAVRGTLSMTPKIGAMRTASIKAPANPDID